MAKAPKLILPKHLTYTPAVELIHGLPDRILTYEDFRPYQGWMSDKMIELPGVIMGAEMGLGKTGAVLKATTALISIGEVKRPLIVAPLFVAENTWPEEIRTWDFARDLTFRVVTGTEVERMAALRQDAQVTIINRENLRWLHEVFAGRGWPFDMLVYDEISRLKKGLMRVTQSREQRKKGVKAGLTELGVMQAHRASHKHIIGLSGTPAPNGLVDLFGPMFAIDHGDRLGRSMTAFLKRWFHEDRYDNSITPFQHSEAEIMGKIKDRFFSLREEDYLTLPPLINVNHTIKLPPKARSIYREMEKELYIELVNRAGDPTFVEAVNRGVLTGKLLQLANGSVYDDAKEGIYVHDEKLGILESIFEEAAGTPVLVAYSFKFDLLAIKKRFPWIRVFGESKDDIRDWNAGKIRGLLTHPASAGHGLNIQKGSNIAVWYGLTWSLELYRQFVKRLHRSGQTRDRVFMHHIIAEDTVDENVLDVCFVKGATQDRITEAVRIRLAA